jgi:small subunit ribosomal protein S4
MKNNSCKICRRVGEKLFLKGEKCSSPKCPLLRKPFPPGKTPRKTTKKRLSEYGEELREAQKLKKTYSISEEQFKKIEKEVLKKLGKEDVSKLLIRRLEKKLFNVIYRAGLATSRRGAKQLVSHGHFILNKRRVDVPSIEVKVKDEIKIKDKSKNSAYFKKILPALKKNEKVPSWLSLDKNKIIIKVVSEPETEDIQKQIDVPLIISFYSK